MLHVKCKICNTGFFPRPDHVKKGWGIYCSSNCKHAGAMTGKRHSCFICKKEILRIPSKIKRSKSGKFFCDKSCQTKWRNTQYKGTKHLGWKGGFSMYRDILRNSGQSIKCLYCGNRDSRVLAVHHVDENHRNNEIKNLVWLCHNCHYLVHHDIVEKSKFLTLR